MKACPHCGAPMAEASPRCPSCGVRKGAQAREIVRDVDKSAGKPVGPLAAVVFAALVLAAALVYLF